MDLTLRLSDELLLRILSIFKPNYASPYPYYALVCKRWLNLNGRLRTSIKLLDWTFLENGRMESRFPNLTDIDLTPACLSAMNINHNFCNILLALGPNSLSIHLEPYAFDSPSIERYIKKKKILSSRFDEGLKLLAKTFPDLQRLRVMDVRKPGIDYYEAFGCSAWLPLDNSASDRKIKERKGITDFTIFSDSGNDDEEFMTPNGDGQDAMKAVTRFIPIDKEECYNENTTKAEKVDFIDDGYGKYGLSYVAQTCKNLQELEFHHCTDMSFHGISACKNLQIMRVIGSVSSYSYSTITDIGLTILARNCNRLVKLELNSCEGSYDGIAAIGQCCVMLEELTISNHGFYEGWSAGLVLCSCLKTLRLENCKHIDHDPRPSENLGYCMALDNLQLVRCNLRDENGFHGLMMLSMNIRQLVIEDCWGLNDEIFSFAATCRYMKSLSLEGCLPLTTMGLENVVLANKELQALRVVYCSNIKDSDVSETLALRIYNLKELKWRPDVKQFLKTSLLGTNIGQHGGKFFKKWGP